MSSLEKSIFDQIKDVDNSLEAILKLVRDIPVDSHNALLTKGRKISSLNGINHQLSSLQSKIQNFIEQEQARVVEGIKQVENSLIAARRAINCEIDDFPKDLDSDIVELDITPSDHALITPETPPPDMFETPQHSWIDVVRGDLNSINTQPLFGNIYETAIKPHQNAWEKKLPYVAEPSQAIEQSPVKPGKRKIAEELFIDAYTITEPSECHNWLGYWCYCSKYNRFYLSINGEVLEAITTIIHPPEVPPHKCLEHRDGERYGNCNNVDWQTSKFYVPRIFNPESEDIREFTGRMKFVPASREPRDNEIYTYRLGSRDTLAEDIKYLHPADFRMFNDLTGNFLLCFTAASAEINKKNDI